MTFAHPLVLLLLILPLWLGVWVWRRESGRVVLPFDYGPVRSGWGWKWLLDSAHTLPVLLLAIGIVLAAGPQHYGEPKQKRSLTNIEFCLDVSMSMTAPFGDGSRYDAAMKAAEEFLSFRSGDAFGLTFFGNNVLHWVPLTTDISAFRCAPPFMRPERLPNWFGGTEIGRALRACRKMLVQREEGDRMIILITDGLSADLFNGQDVEVANELKREGITVYVVLIMEGDIPAQMSTIAEITGGAALSAEDPGSLKTVFARIDEMKQAKLEKTLGDTLDAFQPWCCASLACLALHTLAAFGLRYTPW